MEFVTILAGDFKMGSTNKDRELALKEMLMQSQITEELSRMDPDYDHRLPTECEWEYAARVGSDGLQSFPSDQLFEWAWYFDNSDDKPHPVATLGQLSPD